MGMTKTFRVRLIVFQLLLAVMTSVLSCEKGGDGDFDLSKAKFMVSPTLEIPFRETVVEVLTEEVEKRTSLKMEESQNWKEATLIVLALQGDPEVYGVELPTAEKTLKKEGYRILQGKRRGEGVLWVIGADARGLLYGVGKLLRLADMQEGRLRVPGNLDIDAEPEYALRGHQFGYRNTANSWDAWTVEQFDQHFREQVLFGANSFENIPFQDPESSVHFKIDPREMEVRMSEICAKYQADYWVWTPAPKDLSEKGAHEAGLRQQEDFYARCPKLDGVFVPGGDPGENHPSQLIPYLKDLSALLKKYHPDAGIWVSLQGFDEEKTNYFFDYLTRNEPDWLRGLVNGPSSPPLEFERERLPEKYQYRFYPDITHTVRCHFPVKKWDQAFALTLGREPCNPQPEQYAEYFHRDMGYTDGFITYSDGSHDDVNKVLWSQLGWDPTRDPWQIVFEYCQFYFGAEVADEATEAIFALEDNWDGPILENEGISETLALWQKLEARYPMLADNWRWQQLVMRAYYDAYIKERLAYEKGLETKANAVLARAREIGAEQAMEEALEHLEKAQTELVAQDLKQKVFEYAETLFRSIGAQTSVPKYKARSAERGAVLDFIDHPLNNRWWLEDEFEKIKKLASEEEKLARLEFIRTYEFPGEGSFYDNVSSADAQHVVTETDDAIDYLWENEGISRKRLSTQLFQFSPVLEYEGLNPEATYLIRVSGYGEALLRANGQRLEPTKYEKGFEEFKEFPLPRKLIKNGKLKITFDKPDEEHLNWRKQSRVTDVWLLRQ